MECFIGAWVMTSIKNSASPLDGILQGFLRHTCLFDQQMNEMSTLDNRSSGCETTAMKQATAVACVLLVGGVALLAMACGETKAPNPDPQCQVDDDCGPDYVCEDGECEFDWPEPGHLIIVNLTAFEIDLVNLSPCTSQTWGDNLMPPEDEFLPGELRTYELSPGCWDSRVAANPESLPLAAEYYGWDVVSGEGLIWSILGATLR